MWINTDPVVQRQFWELVQESFSSDQRRHSELLTPTVLFEIMQNMGRVRDCCPIVETHMQGHKANYFLGNRYEAMLPLVNETILFNKDLFRQTLATILRMVARRPCHCLMRQAIVLMNELCERKSWAVVALGNIHGLYVICTNAAGYTTDVKLCCLALARAVVQNKKKGIYNLGEVDASVCSLFSSMYSHDRLSQTSKSVKSSSSFCISRGRAKSCDRSSLRKRHTSSAEDTGAGINTVTFRPKRQHRSRSVLCARDLRRIVRAATSPVVRIPGARMLPEEEEAKVKESSAENSEPVTPETLLAPEGLQADLKSTYFFLLDFMTDYRMDKQLAYRSESSLLARKIRVVTPLALKWIIKLARKVQDDKLSARVLIDLIAISEFSMENRRLIALTEGLAKWLINFEETLRSTLSLRGLYAQAVRFHASLLSLDFPNMLSFQLLLLQHQTHLLAQRSQAGGNMRHLWAQTLAAYHTTEQQQSGQLNPSLWRQIFVLTNSTFESILVLLESKGNHSAEGRLERVFGMPSATCTELVDGVLRLFGPFWRPTLEPFEVTSRIATAKERFERAQPALAEHARLFGISRETRAGLRDRAGVIFTLSQLVMLAFGKAKSVESLSRYLSFAVSMAKYLLILIEHVARTTGSMDDSHMTAPFEEPMALLVAAILYKLVHAESKETRYAASAALVQILEMIFTLAALPKSRAAEFYKKTFVGQGGLLVPINRAQEMLGRPGGSEELCKLVDDRAKGLAERNKAVELVGQNIAGVGMKSIYEEIKRGCERVYQLQRCESDSKQAKYMYFKNSSIT